MALREYNTAKPRSYPAKNGKNGSKKARTISVWIHPDDERYVERLAKRLGITKNRAITQIITDHRANGSPYA